MESEYEETERRLMQLSEELVRLNCEMSVHLQVRKLSRVLFQDVTRSHVSFFVLGHRRQVQLLPHVLPAFVVESVDDLPMSAGSLGAGLQC